MKRDRQRHPLIASMGKRKGSPCQQDGDGDSQAAKIMRSSIPVPDLPEDILFRIHSLLPMREAARSACLSRAFLHSWRCHHNLIFNKDTIVRAGTLCGDYLPEEQRLSSLSVFECLGLNVIESKAPNLSSLFLRGHRLNFSRVETLQMKKLDVLRSNFIRDARAKLPSLMPNLETLGINSGREVVDAPMLPTKFLYLKHLTIWLMLGLTSRPYDYLSGFFP
ncbi:hypothetical protein BAE44_0018847 [Dichanthelium oligosanthes]|uniref:At1g61320/AtMIF1 LRR domain-containing protein n=1 Tax=Dichanthelium oligosanthes TaxID=888268 RepID=A0A1E5V4V1_9POAL|nr:hypothetical protein BAE44_0018847 [Dichanthelium oligosanthes]